MGRPATLGHADVRKVVELSSKGLSQNDIAKHFGVSRNAISQIMTGRTHSNVTGIKPPHSSECKDCVKRDIREDNIAAARSAEVPVQCFVCHGTSTESVGFVLSSRGAVRCKDCDGKRK